MNSSFRYRNPRTNVLRKRHQQLAVSRVHNEQRRARNFVARNLHIQHFPKQDRSFHKRTRR